MAGILEHVRGPGDLRDAYPGFAGDVPLWFSIEKKPHDSPALYDVLNFGGGENVVQDQLQLLPVPTEEEEIGDGPQARISIGGA